VGPVGGGRTARRFIERRRPLAQVGSAGVCCADSKLALRALARVEPKTYPSPHVAPTLRGFDVTPRQRREAGGLSHVEGRGGAARARMVDVGAKEASARSATACATVLFPPRLLARVLSEGGPKGPVVEVARVAGILAAKRTPEWIPMCHTLALDEVAIDVRPRGARRLEIRCRAACHGRTGVEMEALVGASACALVIYDMTKALSHEIVIERVELLEKTGGKSGRWVRGGARGLGSGAVSGPVSGPVSARRAPRGV